jgi:protein PsiE
MQKVFERLEQRADVAGTILVRTFHLLALFAIGGATVWSAVVSFLEMVQAGRADVGDILLLFIYLELGAMVGIYFKTNKMPVRFLIYVAITALTRLMIEIISKTHDANTSIIIISGAILLLAIAELILRYGSVKYPISRGPDEISDRPTSRGGKRAGAGA